jgi:hypothetical protein
MNVTRQFFFHDSRIGIDEGMSISTNRFSAKPVECDTRIAQYPVISTGRSAEFDVM